MPRILLTALLVFNPYRLFFFLTPLSEEAVREAYFLGQRHDESISRALEAYTQYFPIPADGPQITSVTCLTPFALAVLASSNHSGNYSTQQAQIDHRSRPATVEIQVGIPLTDSYPPPIPFSARPSHSRQARLVPRPSDCLRGFDAKVFDGEKP